MLLQCNVISSVISLLLLCHTNFATSYKILVPILTPSKSHYNQAKAICDILHERGHEVTFINGFPSNKLPYKEIIIPEIGNFDFEVSIEDSKEANFMDGLKSLTDTEYFVPLVVNNAFNSKKFQEFLNDKSLKYDLVIIDYMLNDVLLALGVKYDCPVILLLPFPMMNSLALNTGNPTSPATIPNMLLGYTEHMSFTERILNTLTAALEILHGSFVMDKIQEDLYKKYLPEEANKVSFPDLKRRISLVLSNSYHALGFARPYLPNIVEIGGFHIGESEPLSKEYKDILDNAKYGVIYFSMGSFLKTHTMPKHMRDIILKSLSKLKQTVLWKFETELKDLPKNVIIKKWMPQTSILAHPNVKLFISHGGVLSTIEATTAGVPILCIPVFADQYSNGKTIEKEQTGVVYTLDKLTEESLDATLNEVLNNRTYAENAKKLQRLYLDRPMSPRSLVSFYTEHVIRTGGAKHLSAPHLNLFSSMLLDVIAVLLIFPLLVLGAAFYICSRICCTKKSKVVSKKKTN